MAPLTNTTSSPPPSPPSPSPSTTQKNLPPSRSEKGKPVLKSVKPPLHSLSFDRFIYGLALIALFVGSLYVYRLFGYKKDAGGWWNLITGVRRPPQGASSTPTPSSGDVKSGWGEWKGKKTNPDCNHPVGSVEHHITALAGALGMPTPDLTRAIALAIRQYVPPASMASVAAKERETGASGKKSKEDSEIMRILIDEDLSSEDVKEQGSGRPMNIPTPPEDHSAEGGILNNVVGGVESFVGMEEP